MTGHGLIILGGPIMVNDRIVYPQRNEDGSPNRAAAEGNCCPNCGQAYASLNATDDQVIQGAVNHKCKQ